MSYTNAQIAKVIEIALSEFPADHEFTGYGVHVVVNAIHEILDRPSITPQSRYNKIKTFKGIKTMEGITLNVSETSDFINAYLNGKAKSDTVKLSDAIKIKMAQALETIEN